MGYERLKRAFAGIEVSTNDLRTAAAFAEESGHPVSVKANGRAIWAFDQITAIAAEDGMIENLELIASAGGDGRLELRYRPGYIELIADDLPEFRGPFQRITDLLREKSPVKGESNRIVESPAGTWRAPTSGVRGWLAKFLKR